MASPGFDDHPFDPLTIAPVQTTSPQKGWLKAAGAVAAGAVTAAGVYWFVRWRHRYVKRNRRKELLGSYREQMLVPVEHLQEIRDEFQRQLVEGLAVGGRSSLLMLPTMVDVLPTGRETGTFYAIDWGGTNFRTACITLSKKRQKVGEVEMRSYAITDDMKKGSVEALFDLMAERMVDFAAECGESMQTPEGGEAPILGFCFSFPVKQSALDHGTLIRWTKGFELTGAVGEDPVRLLAEAFKRRKLPVQVTVLINDAPGVLAAGRYMNPTTMIGVILGTGTNACYAEQVSKIHRLSADYKPRTDEMCINSEWGAFNADCLPLMQEDRDLDANSVNPGEAIFEKLVSGLYLGEVACRMMLKLAQQGDLFAGRVPEQLHGPVWPFDASFVARIHGDETHDLHITADLLHQAFGYDPSTLPYGARANTKFVCKLVGQRGATLMAAALAALLRHMGRHLPATLPNGGDDEQGEEGEVPQTTVAVDGSMFLKYDKFKAAVMVGLAQIEGKHVANKVVILPAEDGSSIGAACLASAAKAFLAARQQPNDGA